MNPPQQSTDLVFNPAFRPVRDLLEQQIQDGLHFGAQLCVEIDGEAVADFAVGEVIVGSGIKLTNTRNRREVMTTASNVESDAPMIVCEDVTVSFGEFQAWKGISIEVKEGEVVVILGPSGSGKSTFIRTRSRRQVPIHGRRRGRRRRYP